MSGWIDKGEKGNLVFTCVAVMKYTNRKQLRWERGLLSLIISGYILSLFRNLK